MKYVLALDQSTTRSRAILFSENGAPVQIAQREFSQRFPQPGWGERDPVEIFRTQRETTIVWDRQTGEPLHNAIVWQDRRTAEMCRELKEVGAESLVRERTGLVIDPYFSGIKLAWTLDTIPGARERAERGELAFGMLPAGVLGEPLIIGGVAGDQPVSGWPVRRATWRR